MTPSPFVFVLLALAAFRTWKLIGDDTITEPLRKRLTGVDDRDAAVADDSDKWHLFLGSRKHLSGLIRCPWCLGSWVALGWAAGWAVWPDGTVYAAVPFAAAAAVGLVAQASFALSRE